MCMCGKNILKIFAGVKNYETRKANSRKSSETLA